MRRVLASFFSCDVNFDKLEVVAARYFSARVDVSDVGAETEIIFAGLLFYSFYLSDYPMWPLSRKDDAISFVLYALRRRSRLVSSKRGRDAILGLLGARDVFLVELQDKHTDFLDRIARHIAGVRILDAEGVVRI